MHIYLDSSILRTLVARNAPRRRAVTLRLLRAVRAGTHVPVVSNVTVEVLVHASPEARKRIVAGFRAIEFEFVIEGRASDRLLAKYEEARVLPRRYREDLRHVAVATVERVDVLVSWNIRRLANPKTLRAVRAVNGRLRYPLLEIVSPEEIEP